MALSIISFLIAFFVSLISIPLWIRKAKSLGLTGKDIHKNKKVEISEAGGVAVIFSAVLGMLVYIFINTFISKTNLGLVEMLSVILTLLMAGFVGFIDDILGWKVGLKQIHKLMLTIPIAIPLAVINAGASSMNVPLLGSIDLGILFPLVVIPLVIIFMTNSFNMLAGFNGLETGNAIIILTTLAMVILSAGNFWIAVIAMTLVASLLAFWIYNKYPAKIFPGDTLTYSLGASIAAIAIIGNAEKALFILSIPYIAEFFLKLRGKFKKESFGKIKKDGSIENKYKGIYSLTHLSIALLRLTKGKVTEKKIVGLIWGIEILLALVVIFFT